MTLASLTADDVIDRLAPHADALRQAGIHLPLFGSMARGEAGPVSDIDLPAELDPAASFSLLRLVHLERKHG